MNKIKGIIDYYKKEKNNEKRFNKIKEQWYGLIKGYSNIIVYGAGMVTFPELLILLKEVNIIPSAVVDSDQNKQGREICNYKITSLRKIKKEYGTNVLVIIAVRGDENASKSINNALKENDFLNVIQCETWLSYREIMRLPDYNMMSDSKESLILKNEDRILKLAQSLNDIDSISALETIIKERLLPFDCKYEFRRMSYFPKQIFEYNCYNIIVDCGAYRGDTLTECMDVLNIDFTEYHAFEMDPLNVVEFEKKILIYEENIRKKIYLHPYAVSNTDGDISIYADGSVGSYVSETKGDTTVECRKLDTVLKGIPVSYIKMDIEGAEREAIEGAKKTIQTNRPVMAISLYHKDGDLWELPQLINDIVNDYVGYIRCEGLFEYLYFAVPKEKINKENRNEIRCNLL